MTKPVCFIIQEFGGIYDDLYDDVIEIAVKEANALCVRADKILGAKPPLEKIKSSIEKDAAICIAEVSEDNANVFFEVGWAFAVGKPILVLWDKVKRPEGLPFDIHNKAGIPYDSSKPGWRKELRGRLVENIVFELTNNPQPHFASKITISALLDLYLAYCEKHSTSTRTYVWYDGHFKNFLNYLGKDAHEPASSLSPLQIEQWIYNQKDWGASYKRGAITAIQSAYNWAVKRKHLFENPLRNMEKPKPGKRDNPMPPEVYEQILSRIDKQDSFRDILMFIWNTECRPEEARELKAQHVDLAKGVIRIPPGMARTGQKPRIIFLNEGAKEVLDKLVNKHPTGKLFLNSRGQPWTKYALCNRLTRYSKALGGRNYAISDCRNGVLYNH